MLTTSRRINSLNYRMNENLNVETTSVIPTDQIQQRKDPVENLKDDVTPLFSEATEEDVVTEIAKVCA